MLTSSPTGTWLPAWVPQHSGVVSILLLFCSIVQSAVSGNASARFMEFY